MLSVGALLGDLGEAVRAQFPRADWGSIPYGDLTPERPGTLALPDSRLRLAILATIRSPESGEADMDMVATATAASIRTADQARVATLGVPLLGTGVLQLPVAEVAEVAVRAVREELADGAGSLRGVVFVCMDEMTEEAIVEAWREQEGAHELAGGVSTDLVRADLGIPLSEDRLGVAPYVSMLATVIADRATPLPLSVGVFGEWGSGKSYFMGLLRHRVAELAGSGGSQYCATIEQIGFNAWHYADSNLWASLGDHIFRQLAGPDPAAPHRGERLRAELAKVLDQRQELAAAAERARAEAVTLREKVDEAAASQETGARGLLRNLPEAAAHWARMGVSDESEQGRLLVEEIRGTLAEADALRRAPTDRWGRTVLVTAAVVVVAVTFALVALPAWREWLAGVGAFFALVAGAGIGLMARARAGLRGLRELVERLPSDQRAEVAALRRAETEQRIAEAQLDEVVARVGELSRQLNELAPGRRLYTFLADRAHGDAYARNLGLISTIRKDFEQLVALLTEWRDNPGEDDQPPIDRIVLYIDDLDRCSARQVVDVLQAVHLLLAMELFVVVVGVDPRWLLRSLSSCHHEIFDPAPATDGWHVEPEDYLEKILNIPLVLPGMTKGNLSRLLRSLVEPASGQEPETAGSAVETPAPTTSLSLPEIPIEQGAELSTYRPQPPRPLTEDELNLLSTLDPLIGTPREAKRLMNLYRMLRATRDLSEASRFLGADGEPGEYEVVIVLLGLLTAHAKLLSRVLDTPPDETEDRAGGLMHRAGSAELGAFIADLEPLRRAEAWHNRVVGPLRPDEVTQWRRLHRGLSGIVDGLATTDLTGFHLWVPRIRRFSYVLSTGA